MDEDANVDEAITVEAKASNKMENDLRDERNIKAYEDKMNTDIKNINTTKNKNKVYTKQFRTIYEVIQPYIFKETDIFLDDFIKKCKYNAN